MDIRIEVHHWRRTFFLAMLLAAAVFLFHAMVLLEATRLLNDVHSWLAARHGPQNAGRILIPMCFIILFITHVLESLAWAIFIWRRKLIDTLGESLYYTTTSITALGYGDVVQPPPWRMLGPLVAINGVLMFGCSTAFLFLVLQKVWMHL
ncbi:ion channel [Microbulbifer elongatus]|uniref:ion channel n=1 Tax=Microbulbifer elongatus TaxID=86173 RepID=UPI001E3A1FF2|nr:ion channel [Microbulbifer elongatus]